MIYIFDCFDFEVIVGWIKLGYKVFDFGCGDGMLFKYLIDICGVQGWGVEIDDVNIFVVICNGINVIQGNLECGFDEFVDQVVDYVVLLCML